MSRNETDHAAGKSGGKSATGATDPAANRKGQTAQTSQKNKDDWRPEPPDEASGSGQEATRSPAPGEKVHGEKLQSAMGTGSTRGSQSGSRKH